MKTYLQVTKRCLAFILMMTLGYKNANALSIDDNGSISGKITLQDGSYAAGVTIQLEGTPFATQSDESGRFVFQKVPTGNYLLITSFLGYAPVRKNVNVSAGQNTTVNLQLSQSSKQLGVVTIETGRLNKFTVRQSGDIGKMPLKQIENPQVYSVITKELLSSQLAYTVDDAIKNVPGIVKMWDAIARPGSGGSIYTMRGFVTQPNMRNGIAGYTTNKLDASNIERIEVIKGPSATLFGSSLISYGGLINRVSKKPYDHFGGNLAYTGGNFGFNRIAADVNAALDSAKTTLFRFNTSYDSRGSFQDFGNSKAFAIAPSLAYNPTERLSFLFEAEFYQSKSTTPPLFFFYPGMTMAQLGVTNAKDLNVNYRRAYFSDDILQEGRNGGFYTQAKYVISNQWTSQTNISYTTNTAEGPTPYFYLLPGGNTMARMVWSPDGTDKSFEVQQNFNGDFKIGQFRNRVVAGLDFYHYNSNITYRRYNGTYRDVTSDDLFDIIPTNGNIPNYQNFNKNKVDSAYNNSPAAAFPYNVIQKTYTYSAYISDVFNITEQLLVQAGLRVDNFNNRGTFNPATGLTSEGYNQTALSPKFGLVYKILKDQVSIFGNYQNGFVNKNGQDANGDTFKPEQANQWEAGVKLDAFDGRLSGTISYYDIKVQDIVRTDPGNPQFSIQDGNQFSKGIEASITANPTAGFNIVAGYSYNDSKLEKTDPSTEGYRPATAGPAHLANLWISYQFLNVGLKGLGIGLGGNYASENKVVHSATTGTFILPEYTLIDASIYYQYKKARFTLKGNNLGNRKYWTGYSTANPQMLRQILGSVSFNF